MNILEDQVTDLNSLAGSPPISMMMSGETPLSMSGSPTAAEVEGGKKRKADEGPAGAGPAGGSAQQTRAKRNRYISIAWYVTGMCLPWPSRDEGRRNVLGESFVVVMFGMEYRPRRHCASYFPQKIAF